MSRVNAVPTMLGRARRASTTIAPSSVRPCPAQRHHSVIVAARTRAQRRMVAAGPSSFRVRSTSGVLVREASSAAAAPKVARAAGGVEADVSEVDEVQTQETLVMDKDVLGESG